MNRYRLFPSGRLEWERKIDFGVYVWRRCPLAPAEIAIERPAFVGDVLYWELRA